MRSFPKQFTVADAKGCNRLRKSLREQIVSPERHKVQTLDVGENNEF
jgi:hypothetical protein